MRFATQLKDRGLQVAPECRVLKAVDAKAISDARALLDDSQAEAERTREAAKQAYEDEKQRGYDDGLAAGADQIAQRLVELTAHGAEVIKDYETHVPDIVISALRQILGTYDDTELAVKTVKQALRMFHKQTDLTIRVPPDRLEAVRSRVGEFRIGGATTPYIEVVGDRDLPSGGCVVESEFGSVDASVDAQLAVLEQAMRKDMSTSTNTDTAQDPPGSD